jgi:serine/threonine protein kinase
VPARLIFRLLAAQSGVRRWPDETPPGAVIENTRHDGSDASRFDEDAPMIGTLLSGRYRLESKLGSGGMSTVYLAVDETLGRNVAVKVLHREISDQPDQLERFRREARAVARLSHPNLVGVIDAGEDGGHPYIVFEYVPGETLKQRIASQGRLPLDEATAYAIEIGRGLASAHVARLIHRDVKPQNVLIDSDGRAKVTDFGIARSLEVHGLTATGRVLGTTDYVSPEQAMGRDADPATDVYSLGIVLYEMLTGDVPFTAETQVGVAMKHVNDPMPDVRARRPEVSAALAAAVDRSTAKDPRDRYADMNDFLRDLEGALEVEVARAGRSTGEATTVLDSVPPKRRRLLNRRRMSVAGVLLVVAAAAAAIAFAALSGEDNRPSDEPPSESEPTSIPVVAADDFDPPPGDNSEDSAPPEEAIDGDARDTGWATEGYDTETFADIKPGVGLILDAGEDVIPTQLLLTTAAPGWSLEVYGSPEKEHPLGSPADGDWGDPLTGGPIDIDAREQTVDLTATTPNRWFLLWVTKLAPDVDEADTYRVEIDNASLGK